MVQSLTRLVVLSSSFIELQTGWSQVSNTTLKMMSNMFLTSISPAIDDLIFFFISVVPPCFGYLFVTGSAKTILITHDSRFNFFHHEHNSVA